MTIAQTLDGGAQTIFLGKDNCWQAVVPPHHWQTATPLAGEAGYALVACVVVPGFDFADFELSDN